MQFFILKTCAEADFMQQAIDVVLVTSHAVPFWIVLFYHLCQNEEKEEEEDVNDERKKKNENINSFSMSNAYTCIYESKNVLWIFAKCYAELCSSFDDSKNVSLFCLTWYFS